MYHIPIHYIPALTVIRDHLIWRRIRRRVITNRVRQRAIVLRRHDERIKSAVFAGERLPKRGIPRFRYRYLERLFLGHVDNFQLKCTGRNTP